MCFGVAVKTHESTLIANIDLNQRDHLSPNSLKTSLETQITIDLHRSSTFMLLQALTWLLLKTQFMKNSSSYKLFHHF